MAQTPNGGTEGTLPFVDLKQIYDVYFSAQKFKSSKNFQKAIQGYSGKKDPAASVAYAANPIALADGTTFRLPSMTFIGYNATEQALIDQFYGALTQRISTDVGFRQLPAIRALMETHGESLFSLRAPKPLNEGDAKGVAAPADWDTDQQIETIVDPSGLKLGSGTAGKTEFLLRVFHEFMHESFLHYQPDAAYDNSKSLVENLTIELKVDDVLRVDLAYGGARDVLSDLSTALGLTTAEIDKISRGLVSDKVDDYNRKRTNLARAKGVERFNDNTTPAGVLNPAELNALVAAKVLKLIPPPDDIDTPEELADYRSRKSSYTVTKKGLSTYQKEKENLGQIKFEADGGVFDTFEEAVDAALDFAREFFGQYSSQIGQALGSNLGRLVTTDRFGQTVSSVTLGVIGQNLGEVVENVLEGDSLGTSIGESFRNLPQDLLSSGVGAISSFLTAELFEELDIGGTLGELGQSAAAQALSAIIQNLGAITSGATSIAEVVTNGVNLVNIIGSYIGTRLASELVEFDTIGGQIGSAVGSAVGVTIGAAAGLDGVLIGVKIGSIAGPIGAVIGAFVGFILGGVIGSLFGGTPRSGAEMGWDAAQGEFVVGRVWSKSGGSKDAARGFATSVAEVLNGIIAASGSKVIDAAGVRTGNYGTRKKDFVYWATRGDGAGEVTFKTRNAEELISHGAAIGAFDLSTRLMGGNVHVKRAIAATVAQAGGNPAANGAGAAGQFAVSTLLGNIATAQDYASYLANPDPINALIAAEPNSTFTANWSVTFARALELGLMKRGATDWIGGWTAFLDEKMDGAIDGIALTPANLGFAIAQGTHERLFALTGPDGELVGVAGDTIDTAGKDLIQGTAASDFITVSNDRITNASGLTINGAAASGQHIIDVAARIEGGAGNDTVRGGDLGNDLLGGDGNDTLVGGKLDDWLFGEAGNDRLFAGAANPSFADGDAAGTAAALAVSGNGDLLDGGEGEDVLYGSAGSDWLKGGAGVDLVLGGSGGDVIDGGQGNDRGPANEARLLGGAGTDQYVFGRGDGHDVIFDESDNASSPGAFGDSLHSRLQNIEAGALQRNWAGGGDYERDGSIKGGEDAIVFGPGIGFQDLILRRSGTAAAPGQDLIIELSTTDTIVVRDWFESTRRVEWLRFSNGEEIRIGDINSFFIGSSGPDIIVGTQAADFLWGGDGNDTLYGLEGNDFGFGGTGRDLIGGDEDNDFVAGGADDDKVLGDAGNDTTFGDAGNDVVYGGLGSDIVVGGRDNDEVAGGAGNDVFRYERGDGRDTLFDDFVNNWELVWQNGGYTNGYVLNEQTGTVSKNGQVVFDGTQWLGLYDWANLTRTFRIHLGAVGGVLAANNGTDSLEFGVGIDIQDLMLRRNGSNLEIAIGTADGDARAFEAIDDRITLRDWYATGASIENFVFAATGRHAISTWNISGAGTDGADTIAGTSGIDWITGNGGDDSISGNAGADLLSGNGGADVITGGTGDDVLYGGDADDVLDGGAGADVLIGGAGTDIASYASAPATGMRAFLNAPGTNTLDGAGDTYDSIEGLEGTNGADKLGGDDNDNVLRGLGGNDTLYGGAGDDIYEIDLGHGQDTIFDAPFVTEQILDSNGVLNTALYSATWTDLGFGPTALGDRFRYRLVVTRIETGEEVYRSRDNVDFLFLSPIASAPSGNAWPFADGQWRNGAARTGNGAQTAREIFQSGNGGNDTLELGAGIGLSDLTFARLNGGADLQITYAASNFVTLVGQNNPNNAIETLQLRDGLVADLTRLRLPGEAGTNDVDFMVGDGGMNTLEGLGGNDILSGGAGNDTLRGGDGDDILEGGAGADVLDGGADSVSAGLPLPSDPTSPYGDTLRYVRSNTGVNINLETGLASGGHATGDTFRFSGATTVENVVGSDGFNDSLTGDSRANRLSGLGGNDTLDGRGGNDVLSGGIGNDTLRGGDGEDNLTGDDGGDTLRGGDGNDLLFGGFGLDDLSGDAGNDVLSGGDDDDILDGGIGDDRVGGEDGADQLYGGEGADELVGGAGGDTIYGGDGNDTLVGGAGDFDFLYGESGDDDYVFDSQAGTDLVFDADGRNRIVVSDGTPQSLWLTRVGDDLRIGIIGSTSSLTIQSYFTPDASVMREIALATHSLFLSSAQPLIDAMTAISSETPAAMPPEIADLLEDYWFEGGRSAPIVTDQTVSTNEDAAVSGSVGATDPDNNIVSYEVQTQPGRGSVTIDSATGAWTYTPNANVHGEDQFEIVVIDADDNRSVQNVTVTIVSVNDAPSDIQLTGAPTSIPERDRPPQGTLLEPIVLGTLTATDVDAPDPGDFASHVFSVTDSRFEVVNGNVLRLRGGVALDFETTPTVSVDVTVTDRNGGPQGLSFTKTFTFTVEDRDDYFYGTPLGDTITGTAGRNLIYGFAGGDTLTGAGTVDVIEGGDGNDTLFGLGGDDTLDGGLGDDVMEGGAGLDTLRGGDGIDVMLGQDGDDQLSGGGSGDQLFGGIGNDLLEGGDGTDRLEGNNGDDRLVGGDSDDYMLGGAGADRFLGGAGFDTVTYEQATAAVTVNLAAGTGSAGEAAGDVFEDTPERLIGSIFGDTLTGSANGDTVEGGAGNDVINGGAGNDLLIGGDGGDTIDAQAGDDTLIGGAGNDILIGGDGDDTYLMDLNSGADEIRNFDPDGTDIDVVGFREIAVDESAAHKRLWFEQSGLDLVVTVVESGVQTTIKDWYFAPTDRSNYRIDFIIAGDRVTRYIDAEMLVTLMSGYPKPTTLVEYEALHATPAFAEVWRTAWKLNQAPTVPELGPQTINEDGTLTLTIRITDDFTPAAGVTVTALADDLTLVNAPTLSAPNSAGDRTLTVTTKPNTSGSVNIRLQAIDAGGVQTERVFTLTINPVADTPIVTLLPPATPVSPATKPSLDSGSWPVNLDASLVDQDGSETLEIRIANVPSQLSFNAGTILSGDGSFSVWSFTRAQLVGLRILGPATWAQDLALSITAISRETATGQIATSAPVPLNIEINARPTTLTPDRTLAFNENTAAGTGLAWFVRTDPDSGDTATYTLLNNAGGRFTLRSDGLLSAGSTPLNYEAVTSHTISVQVTDSGGLSLIRDFTVAVNDVNEPLSLGNASFSVAENSALGTLVGTVAASDPDTANPAFRNFRYRIVGGDTGAFSIDSVSGQIRLQTSVNYEVRQNYSVTVEAWDGGAFGAGNVTTATVSIGVGNVNEAPTITTTGFTVPEGTHGGPGSVLAQVGGAAAVVTGVDPEGSALRYQLIGGDTGVFSIEQNGTMHLHSPLDFETRTSYSVTVRAWDGGAVGVGNFHDAVVPITVANVNEAPKITAYNSAGSESIGFPGGSIRYFGFTAVDPEGNAITSASVVSGAGVSVTLGDSSFTPTNDTLYISMLGSTLTQQPQVTIRLTDSLGAVADTTIQVLVGPPRAEIIGPIALDLDGDGIELIAVPDSGVQFDMDGDGIADPTGWVGTDDAFLALDRNDDGVITNGSEISFTQDLPGAQTDLEGLAAFDTNQDGYFGVEDERFADFRVWQDANEDGISQASELASLSERDIRGINLTRTPTGLSAKAGVAENTLLATSEFVRGDGSLGTVGDVSLGYLGTDITVDVVETPDDEQVNRTADSGREARSSSVMHGFAEPAERELEPSLGRAASGIRIQPAPEPRDDSQLTEAKRPEWRMEAASPDRAWEYQADAVPTHGALHSPLDRVFQRRLQMIEAMASFDAEGSATLDLQPQRRIDPRTYDLLTAVSLTGPASGPGSALR